MSSVVVRKISSQNKKLSRSQNTYQLPTLNLLRSFSLSHSLFGSMLVLQSKRSLLLLLFTNQSKTRCDITTVLYSTLCVACISHWNKRNCIFARISEHIASRERKTIQLSVAIAYETDLFELIYGYSLWPNINLNVFCPSDIIYYLHNCGGQKLNFSQR